MTLSGETVRTPTTDLPPLVDRQGIAELLGLSRQRIHQLLGDLPEPSAKLACGRIWVLDDIVHWAEINGRELDHEAYEHHCREVFVKLPRARKFPAGRKRERPAERKREIQPRFDRIAERLLIDRLEQDGILEPEGMREDP